MMNKKNLMNLILIVKQIVIILRYKKYNEVYNKDYPEEKKFKTDLIHDFTEEEIKENYENMINKDKLAMDKWEFMLLDERNTRCCF
jgi:hypothetical protein